MKISVTTIATTLLMMFCATVSAQTDSRRHNPETKVEQALGQIASTDTAARAAAIRLLASEGEAAVTMTANIMDDAAADTVAVCEQALGALVAYAASDEGASHASAVRKGMLKALDRVNSNAARAFIMSLLPGCVEPSDAPHIAKYLELPELADAAAATLAQMPDIDEYIVKLMRDDRTSRALLAKIAWQRSTPGTEDILLGWADGADAQELVYIYKALGACGGEKSLSLFADGARKVGFADDPLGVTGSYVALLMRGVADKTTTVKAAQELMDCKDQTTRRAGLRLMMKTQNGDAALETALKALRDKDRQYRTEALDCAAEYCGRKAFGMVSARFSKLDDSQKTDVVLWYGRNKAEEGIADITKTIKKSKGELLEAAISAAAQIGVSDALDALIDQLKGRNGNLAREALLNFKGDISDGIVDALSSKSEEQVIGALDIASERHIYKAFEKTAELTASKNKDVSDAAYAALAGVVSPGDYGRLTVMMEKADPSSVPAVTAAMLTAASGESRAKQFDMAVQAKQESSRPEAYYPMIAQAGTNEAIHLLAERSDSAAAAALRTVESPDIMPFLLGMARRQSGSERESLVERYVELASKVELTPAERYLVLSDADNLVRSGRLRNSIITAMGATHTLQALNFIRRYYTDPTYADTASAAVREIVGGDADLNGGNNVQAMLQNAVYVYDSKGYDEDALRSLAEARRLLDASSDNGYSLSLSSTKMKNYGFWNINEELENFDLSFDWKTKAPLTVKLRNMWLITIDEQHGVMVGNNGGWKAMAASPSEWRTADIRICGDSLWVSINGHTVVDGAAISGLSLGQPLVKSGGIGFMAGNDTLVIRNTRLRRLPSTAARQVSDTAPLRKSRQTVAPVQGTLLALIALRRDDVDA